MKILRKLLRNAPKVINVFVSFVLLFTYLFPVAAFAVELSEEGIVTDSNVVEEVINDVALQEVISDSQSISKDTEILLETKVSDLAEVSDVEIESTLEADVEDNSVKVGVKYSLEEDSRVSVVFNALPEFPTYLIMDSYQLDINSQITFGVNSSVVYEMRLLDESGNDVENGLFEYDMTLPTDEGNKVIYAESLVGLKNAQSIESEKVVEVNDLLVIDSLDHFTVFVVTFEDTQNPAPVTPGYNDIWFDYGGTITKVASGTNGIISAQGDNHAIITGSVFTRWDGYKSTFSTYGYDTKVDIYLDMSLADGSDKRFDYSSAISNTTGAHRRDFIFNVATDPVNVGQWIVSASNNAPGNPAGSATRFNVSTSGWYTFEHQFRANASNELVVTMNLYQLGNPIPVATWIRTDPSDIIGITVGGNRYGWFTGHRFDFAWLAIDNSHYIDAPNPCPYIVNIDTTETFCSIQEAIDSVNTLDGHTISLLNNTYVVSSTINVNKELNIIGETKDNVVIDMSALSGYGWNIYADNVTIENMTVLGTAGNANTARTFKFGNPMPIISNGTLRNISVDGSYKTAFDIHGVDNFVGTNLTATNTVSGNGLSLTGVNGAVITGYSGSNNAWGDIALYSSIYTTPNRGSSNITIYDNVNTGVVYGQDTSVSLRNDIANINVIGREIFYPDPMNDLIYVYIPLVLIAPIQTGYNVNDGTSAGEPRDPNQIACTGGFTNVNGVSVHWSDVSGGDTYVKYQRQYSSNGSTWNGAEVYTNPYTNYRTFGFGQVTHYSRVRAFYDINSNNQFNTGEPVSDWSNPCGITYDATAPVTTDSGTDANWHNTDVTVNFSCTDANSGCDKTYYRLNGGAFVEGNSVTLTADGTYLIDYYSTDLAGNSEGIKSAANTVKIDKTAPVMPTGLKRQNAARTQDFMCGSIVKLQTMIPDWDDVTGDSTFSHYEYTSFNSDGSIGLNEQVMLNSEFVHSWVPTVEGTYGYVVRSVDFAGNKSDWALAGKTLAGSCQITYDSTAPKATVSFSDTLLHDSDRIQTVTLVYNEKMNTTVDPTIIFITPTNGNWSVYTAGNWNDEYTYEIEYRITDGNEETTGVRISATGAQDIAGNIGIDLLNPTDDFDIDTKNPSAAFMAPSNGEKISGNYILKATGHDDMSGVAYARFRIKEKTAAASTYVTLNQDPTSPYQYSFNTTTYADGEYTLRLRVQDGAGNFTLVHIDITIDNTKPVITLIGDNPQIIEFGNTYNELGANASDNIDGDISSEITIDSSNVDVSTLGEYIVKYNVTDEAGNVADEVIRTVKVIDTVAPTISKVNDIVWYEGSMIDTSNLLGAYVQDNYGLDSVYFSLRYLGLDGSSVNLGSMPFSLLGNDYAEVDQSMVDMLVDFVTLGSGKLFTVFLPEGKYTINYYVTDEAGNRSDCDLDVEGDQDCETVLTAENVKPSVELNSDQTVGEGEPAVFSGRFDDPSYMPEIWATLCDIEMIEPMVSEEVEEEIVECGNRYDDMGWKVSVDYGDGTILDLGEFLITGDVTIPNHSYVTEGVYTVRLTVQEGENEVIYDLMELYGFFSRVDGEGEVAFAEVEVTVTNVKPTLNVYSSATTLYVGTSALMTAEVSGENMPYQSQNWSGACSGTGLTAYAPSTLGTHTCTFTVVDADGDVVTGSASVNVIPAPIVPVVNNQNENDQKDQDKTEEGEVLGEQDKVCNLVVMKGIVFADSNSNEVKDNGELTFAQVEVVILTKNDKGEEVEVKRIKTQSDGFWQAEVCAGDYFIKVTEDTVPVGYELVEKGLKEVKAASDQKEILVQVAVEKEMTFIESWWWLILLILIILGFGGFVVAKVIRNNK